MGQPPSTPPAPSSAPPARWARARWTAWLTTSRARPAAAPSKPRLAGVVVSALKEAFDRDSARLEMEQAQIEAERKRAEELLRVELRRQAAERMLGQLRLIAVIAVGTWAVSAILGAVMPGMRDALPRVLLAAGWVFVARLAWRRLRGLAVRLDTIDADPSAVGPPSL